MCIWNRFSVQHSKCKGKQLKRNKKSINNYIFRIFKKVLDFKDATFRLSNHFWSEMQQLVGQTNKEDLVSIIVLTSHNRKFGVFW